MHATVETAEGHMRSVKNLGWLLRHWKEVLYITVERTPDDEGLLTATLRRLGGESTTVQVHRFNHWACGWFEIILTKRAPRQRTNG